MCNVVQCTWRIPNAIGEKNVYLLLVCAGELSWMERELLLLLLFAIVSSNAQFFSPMTHNLKEAVRVRAMLKTDFLHCVFNNSNKQNSFWFVMKFFPHPLSHVIKYSTVKDDLWFDKEVWNDRIGSPKGIVKTSLNKPMITYDPNSKLVPT